MTAAERILAAIDAGPAQGLTASEIRDAAGLLDNAEAIAEALALENAGILIRHRLTPADGRWAWRRS